MPKRKIKEPVRLREKEISGGKYSLYLDYYSKGKRAYEFLKLYVWQKPKNEMERQHNRELYALGNSIKSQRIADIQKGKFGMSIRKKGAVKFIPYFSKLAASKEGSNWNSWATTRKYLILYAGEKFTFADIDKKFVRGFRDMLTTQPVGRREKLLSDSSAGTYFGKFKAAMHQAQVDEIIVRNPCIGIKGVPRSESKREYLTIEEMQRLAATECDMPLLRRAFLFSCLTGMRVGDIRNLTWGSVRFDGENAAIHFRQKKTKGSEVLPINEDALELMGEPGSFDEKVFANIENSTWDNNSLKRWVMRAGITKNITFHSARHTYATMLLTQDVDIFTVSKLLGHRNLETTKIYAKIIDKKKNQAVERLPKLMGGENEEL